MAFQLQIMILTLGCLFFSTDSKVIKQASTILSHKKCCITDYGPVMPLSFEQIVRKQAKKSFSSVIDAGADLSKLKQEFNKEQKSLKAHLKKAQEMAAKLKKKIKGALEDITGSLNRVMKEAKEKLATIKGAAKKLGDLEEEVGSSETTAKAVEVRAKINQHPSEKETKLEKDILSENRVIATLDAARLIAQSAAEKKESEKEEKSKKLVQEAKAIENAMTTAEKNLDNEAETELKDERIAKQKIKEALEHNKKAVKGAAMFLKNLEDKITKFQNDIKTLHV